MDLFVCSVASIEINSGRQTFLICFFSVTGKSHLLHHAGFSGPDTPLTERLTDSELLIVCSCSLLSSSDTFQTAGTWMSSSEKLIRLWPPWIKTNIRPVNVQFSCFPVQHSHLDSAKRFRPETSFWTFQPFMKQHFRRSVEQHLAAAKFIFFLLLHFLFPAFVTNNKATALNPGLWSHPAALNKSPDSYRGRTKLNLGSTSALWDGTRGGQWDGGACM